MSNKCVYFHINPLKNEVFYVGIGSIKRSKSKKNRNIHWNNTVNKYGYIIDVIHNNLTWSEATEKEKYYINFYGRKDLNKGSLVNLTDGGDGANGAIRSKELKEHLRNINLGKKQSLEAKLKQIKAQTGTKRTEETRLKMSAWQLGRKMSDEFKLNKSLSQLGDKNHNYGKKHSPETLKKMSEARKKYYQDKNKNDK